MRTPTPTTSAQERTPNPSKGGGTSQPRAGRASATRSAAAADVRSETGARQTRRTKSTGAERPVRLAFRSPSAQEVFVAGSFNGWQPATRLTREGDEWAVELNLKPGAYEYRFVVDGQWIEDPAAREQATNPFGGCNSVVRV